MPTSEQEALLSACKDNDLEKVKHLLSDPDLDVNRTDSDGNYPLLIAIAFSNTEIVKLLLSHQKIDVNKRDYGCPTLLNAIKFSNEEILKLLLSHPNIDVNMCDSNGIFPLHRAVTDKNAKFVELLLLHPKIDANKCGPKGIFPLLIASIENNPEIVKLLLSHPDIDVNKADQYGSPLSETIPSNKIEIVKLLLSHPKIDVNRPSPYSECISLLNSNKQKIFTSYGGRIPLLDSDKPEMVKLLLSHQNIDVNKCDRVGNYPIVVFSNNTEILDLLLANPKTNVSQIDKDGRTALTSVVYNMEFSPGTKVKLIFHLLQHPECNLTEHDITALKTSNIFKKFAAFVKNTDHYAQKTLLPISSILQLIENLKLLLGGLPQEAIDSIEKGQKIGNIFGLTVFYSDGFFKLKEPQEKNETQEEIKRFFKIQEQLPMELQMKIANVAYSSTQKFIPQDEINLALAGIASYYEESEV